MIDFHCHLDLYPEALKLLPEVSERNSFTLVVTTSPRAWQATSSKFAGYSNIKVALGMHPEIVVEKVDERALLISCISQASFIGEIGIDGSVQHQKAVSLQESIMIDVLCECERVGGRILSIHSRNATSLVLGLLEQYCQTSIPVLHWFSGTVQEARRAATMGCWFSVSPAMLLGTKGRTVLHEIPIDKILPETDGPFTRNGAVPFMPWDAVSIVKTVASCWDMTEEDVLKQFEYNLSALLRSPIP